MFGATSTASPALHKMVPRVDSKDPRRIVVPQPSQRDFTESLEAVDDEPEEEEVILPAEL